jgi:Zn-dependent protease with chaperone function
VRLDWTAAYLDGRTAVRRKAVVRISRSGLEIAVPETGAKYFWRFGEIRQTQGRYAGEHVRLERGGELAEAIIINDVAFLSAARAVSPEATHLHDPARRRFRVGLTLGALGLAIGLALGLYFVAIPAFAALAATRVPVAWEASLGEAVAEQVAPPARRCEDPERQATIDAIVAAVLAPAQPQPYTFRVVVVNSKVVNAVAAPGGSIVVFRGLLDQTDSAEELAGVLAHEVEHVLHRHVTRAIFQHASTGVLMAALVGDVSGAVAFGLEGARTLGDLRMSRQAESEADRDGMRLLQRTGIDPGGMVSFFEKLQAKDKRAGDSGLSRYLATHPATAERIAALRAMAAESPKPPQRLLPDVDWSDVKTMCGAARPR